MDEPWVAGWSGGRFQIRETTADIGVLAEAASLPAAIGSAAAGMYHVMSPGAFEDRGRRLWIAEQADDLPLAVARTLQRLVIAFDTDGFVGAHGLASVYRGTSCRVTLELYGETFDPARHAQGVEIKAVTHHQITVDAAKGRVEVLLDV